MKRDPQIRLITNIISLVLCALLLVISIFAWYVTNETATVTGVTGLTSDSNQVHFTDKVTAVRHSLNGDVITNTYTRQADGTLILTKSKIVDKNNQQTLVDLDELPASEKTFKMTEILPSEYIDITIGYYMDDTYDGKGYYIRLDNIVADSFTIDGKTHYASGAFKYKNISLVGLVDENETTLANFGNAEFAFFTTYDISKNDSSDLRVKILSHTWNKNYEEVKYTFRIQEDFSQYYSLISQAQSSYGNLLSKKKLSIGNIFLFGD